LVDFSIFGFDTDRVEDFADGGLIRRVNFLNMRVIAAYLLAVVGGNASPDKAAISKILDSVGIKAEDAKIDQLLKSVEGKDLDELIKAGTEKLAAVGSGGGGGAGPGPYMGPGGEGKQDENHPIPLSPSILPVNSPGSFGNDGGVNQPDAGSEQATAGGGGAGSVGGDGEGTIGGEGGNGLLYNIADGTTSVGYAGGGAGAGVVPSAIL
jgi:large subunit ribosomal protein LP2